MMTREEKVKALALLEEKDRRKKENFINFFKPNRHQKKFCDATKNYTELMFCGGNRTGKTTIGCYLDSIYATGKYPDFYRGKVFDGPTRILIVGESDKQLRRAAQRVLCGEEGQWGTGMLPKNTIYDENYKPTIYYKRDPKGCIDYIQVKHEYGDYSYIYFGTYGQGREIVQGDELHVIHCDEAPPAEIYWELRARVVTTNGVIFTTATPLTGTSEIFESFVSQSELGDEEVANKKYFINVSLNEVDHIGEKEKQEFINSLPEHQKLARIEGLPILGDGLVYDCNKAMVSCEPFDIARTGYHRFLIGMDFGYNDPTVAILFAHDPNSDMIYAIDCYQKDKALPDYHAIQIRQWGEKIPVAWPRDGHRIGLGSTSMMTIKDQYRRAGLNMLPRPAFSTYTSSTDGSNREAGIQIVYQLIHGGKVKIFDNPRMQPLIKTLVMYHRKDGKVAKNQNDHLPDAFRVGLCEIKRAQAGYELDSFRTGNGRPKLQNTSYSLRRTA